MFSPIKDSVNIADGTLLPLSHCGSMSSSRILHDRFHFPPQNQFLSVTLQLTIFVSSFLLMTVLSTISAREGSLAGWESFIIRIFFSTFLFFSCFIRIRNGTRRRLRHRQDRVQDFFHCLGYIPAFHSDGLNNSCDCLQLAIVCSWIKHKNPIVPLFNI